MTTPRTYSKAGSRITRLVVGCALAAAFVSQIGCPYESSMRPEMPYTPFGSYYTLDSALGNPTDVRHLHLMNMGYDSIPFIVTSFPNLLTLDMLRNRITDIPVFLTLLKELDYRRLDNNQLDSINTRALRKTEAGSYAYMTIDLDSNDIWKMPDNFQYLLHVDQLSLEYNKITSIPRSISLLSESLWVLSLVGNPLTEAELDTARILLPKTRVIF